MGRRGLQLIAFFQCLSLLEASSLDSNGPGLVAEIGGGPPFVLQQFHRVKITVAMTWWLVMAEEWFLTAEQSRVDVDVYLM